MSSLSSDTPDPLKHKERGSGPIDNNRTVEKPDPWEAAYLRFETPEEEVNKFIRRLIKLGSNEWPRDAEIVEIFCGRGNGLNALNRLGFTRLTGVDLSPRLVAEYRGNGKCLVGDCRNLPLISGCKDIVIVQGGLHHLVDLPDDLEQTLKEVNRILKSDGRLVIVEPWSTPFLSFVHFVSEIKLVRKFSNKIDAFATMTYYEQETYFRWLAQPQMVLDTIKKYFLTNRQFFGWGKFMFVGNKRVEY